MSVGFAIAGCRHGKQCAGVQPPILSSHRSAVTPPRDAGRLKEAQTPTGVTRLTDGTARVRFRRCIGHTLIELLIASALGASVIAAALTLQQRATRDNARVADTARMQMDGLAAIELLRTYALLAGYGDHLTDARSGSQEGAPMVGCTASARDGEGDCAISDAVSDGVAIRYFADPVSVWRSGARDAPADCEGVALNTLRGNAVRAYLRVRVAGTSSEHRLHCSSRVSVAGEPMVGGLEGLQLRYWVDEASAPLRAEQLAMDDWHRVRGIDACVVVKGRVMTSPRSATSGHPACGQSGSTASTTDRRAGRGDRLLRDGYRRMAFRVSIALRNTRHASGSDRPNIGIANGHSNDRGPGEAVLHRRATPVAGAETLS